MKNSADLGGCYPLRPRPLWITPSLICRILHILRKANSIIANYFILSEIFGQNQSHEKLIRKLFHPITIANRLSHTWENCRFIQSEISCQNESVSSQTRSRCFWRLFNLHSQRFVEFPQVYSSFPENHSFAHPRGPRGYQPGRCNIFGRKFTSRVEEPLGTYSYRTSSR